MLMTPFKGEFMNACGKTLFESLVYWDPIYFIKMFSSDVLSVAQLLAETYTCFVKPAICFYISYLNLDTRLHMCSRDSVFVVRCTVLTHLFPMHPFSTPENRKP